MEMTNDYNIVKTENLRITSDDPIPNMCNALSQRKPIKTEISETCVNDLPHETGAVIKIKPTDNTVPLCQLIKTEKSGQSEDRTHQDPSVRSCLPKKEEPTGLMENHGNAFHKVNQTIKSLPTSTSVKRKRFVCYFCDRHFSKSSSLVKHKRTHNFEKPFVCNFCGKWFFVRSLLIEHKQTHTGEKPYVMERTNAEKFMKSENLTITSDCPIVNMSNTSSETKLHEKCYNVAIKTEPTDNTLSESQLIKNEKSDRTIHVPIEQCFLTKKDEPTDTPGNHGNAIRRVNETTKTAVQRKSYDCDICDKQFSRSRTLVQHRRTHTGEKPFVCNLCEKSFSQSYCLTQHKRIHSGEKPFVCDVCGKRFSHSCYLKQHKRSHTGEKPYVCDFCDKSFSQSGHLKTHKRTHTGEYPFVYDECGRQFLNSTCLVKHRRTHTGEKPFVCDLCDKAFSRASSLTYHKRVHLRETSSSVTSVLRDSHVPSSSPNTDEPTPETFVSYLSDESFVEFATLTQHKGSHTGEKSHVSNL